GLVGTDDLELRLRELRELDGGPHRLGGGLRAIGSNHYAVEHHPSSPNVERVARRRTLTSCGRILPRAPRPPLPWAQLSLTIAITIDASRQATRITSRTAQRRGTGRS